MCVHVGSHSHDSMSDTLPAGSKIIADGADCNRPTDKTGPYRSRGQSTNVTLNPFSFGGLKPIIHFQ